MLTIKRLLAAILGVLSICQMASAAEESLPNWQEETLTGDWGGARASLYKSGVDFKFTHKSDVLANVSGGIQRGTTWMGHTEAQANLDLDKLLGWPSTTAFVHYHSDLGGKFNTHYVGGFVGEDNIEVATNTAQFYQAWLQKGFLDDHVAVLVGLYAIDTEFYVTESSGIFLQAPYGMANEFAQAGDNGPPIFPMGALAVRVRVLSPDQNFYLQAALTDGVPGDPNNPHGTHIKLGNGDGTLSVLELGYKPSEATSANPEQEPTLAMNKVAIGFWRFSNQFDDLMDIDALGNPIRRHSQGAYLVAEHTLFVEKDHPSQGLTGFFRFGLASEDIHQADWSSSLGVNYKGLIDGRDDDVLGVAMTVNHASDKYQLLNNAVSPEIDLEMTYRAQIKPWLALQPTVQYISNPGMDKTLKDATIIGFRTEVAF